MSDMETRYKRAKEIFEQGQYIQHSLQTGGGPRDGIGDSYQAAAYYQKAAEMGYAPAQCAFGWCYSHGIRVEQNYANAFEWYSKAAEQGHAEAQCNLGECYYTGNGVKQDYSKAFEWFVKAAKQGNKEAQYYIGLCYQKGKGVDQDDTKAIEWLLKAWEGKYYEAGKALVEMGYEFPKEETDPDEEEFRKITGYSLGSCEIARNNRGCAYHHGKDGKPVDYAKAMKWYKSAAEYGNAVSMRHIGELYRDGLGVAKDLKAAEKWFRKAAAKGDEKAEQALSEIEEERCKP